MQTLSEAPSALNPYAWDFVHNDTGRYSTEYYSEVEMLREFFGVLILWYSYLGGL